MPKSPEMPCPLQPIHNRRPHRSIAARHALSLALGTALVVATPGTEAALAAPGRGNDSSFGYDGQDGRSGDFINGQLDALVAGGDGGSGGTDGVDGGNAGPGAPGTNGGGDGGDGGDAWAPDGGGGGGGGEGARLNGDLVIGTGGMIRGGNGGAGGDGQGSFSAAGSGGDAGDALSGSGAYDLLNRGRLQGGHGGDGGSSPDSFSGDGFDGGRGFAGSEIAIVNEGEIRGGNGGDAGDASDTSKSFGGIGGNAGHGIEGTGLAIENKGVIAGGDGGLGSATASRRYGRGGDGISGADLTIYNAGTISAGSGGVDPINGLNGTAGNAITFTGGTNRLILAAGTGTINGTVSAGGTRDTLVFGDAPGAGGSSGTFDLSRLGAGLQFDGFEALEQDSTADWTFTGNAAGYTGTTTVTRGRMDLQGTLGGQVLIAADGILGGAGTLAGPVTISGHHDPGNGGFASQSVTGDYTLSGTLVVDLSDSAHDTVDVSGAVDITGADLEIRLQVPSGTAWNGTGGPLVIIRNDGADAVAGTFGTVSGSSFVFFDTILDYAGGTGNDVTLEIRRNARTLADIGRTRNQRATAGGIGSLPTSSAIREALLLSTDEEEARAALDTLSGESHASAQGRFIADSAFLRRAAGARIRDAFDQTRRASARPQAFAREAAPLAAPADRLPVIGLWSEGYGTWGTTRSDGNAARTTNSAGGIFVGADAPLATWRLGVLAGFGESRLESDAGDALLTSRDYHLAAYAATRTGALGLSGGVGYTWHDVSSARTAGIGSITDRLTASYTAGTFQAFGEAGYTMRLATATFEPFAALAHVAGTREAFAESGGATALFSTGQRMDTTFSTLGMRARHSMSLGDMQATLEASAGWQHAFGQVVPLARNAFSGGSAFTVAGAPLARDTALLDAGLTVSRGDATLSLSYSGRIAAESNDHGLRGRVSVRF
uniref:autotransporter outer membrane beta-barrel domain-containing protein n=1 Tax=Stappia sp. TaxID=1870903 RepID=UPI003BA84B07